MKSVHWGSLLRMAAALLAGCGIAWVLLPGAGVVKLLLSGALALFLGELLYRLGRRVIGKTEK